MRAAAVVFAIVVAIPSPLLAQLPERSCTPTEHPKTLPSVSALVDSARIVRGLTGPDVAPKGILFSLVYGESDSFPQVHVIESSIDSAGLLLANTFVPQKPKKLWAVRLRVSAAAAPTVTLERSIYCLPRLAQTQDRLGDNFLVNVSPGDRALRNLNIRIKANVIIAENGVVSEVQLSQSTGFRDYDDQIVQFFRMRRYLPALIDGFPVTSWWRSDGQRMRL
jgi:hypothetical protein